MSNEMQLRPSDALPDVPQERYGGGDYGYRENYGDGGTPEETLFHKIHRLMRGRYHWAILLGGLIGVVIGGYLYKTTLPLWTSTGTIQVKAMVLSPLGRSDLDFYPFEMLKDTQVNILRGQRLAEVAMQKSPWQALGRDTTSVESLVEFLGSITVVTSGKSEMIEVKFSDPERKAAEAGIKSVMLAYRELRADEASAMEKVNLDQLVNYRDGHVRKLNEARERLRLLAQANYGTDDLRDLHRAKVDEMTRYNAALTEAELARSGMQVKPKTPDGDKKSESDADALTDEQIADRDSRMSDLIEQRAQAEAQIKFLEANGVGPNNPKMIQAQLALAQVKKRIEDRRRQYIASGAGRSTAPVPGVTPGMTKEQLEETIAKLTKLRNDAQKTAEAMGKQMLEMESIRKQIASLEGPIEELEKKIQIAIVKEERIRVVSEGDRARVVKDSRFQYGAAGGLGGMFMGFCIVLFFSMFDRRFRTPEEARNAGRMALLGVLPNLPDDLSDPEQAAIAAHCVHQIRTLLQIGSAGDERRVFAVTSPAAGTGKTSLCLSLGVSFAASQARTLLIDCDLIGGGLTIRVDAIVRRKIGQILKREGLVTQQQLEMAMKLARNSHKKFGEILVDLGHLSQQDVERALTQQEESPIGLLDALAGEDLMECVAETGIAGLSILPLGSAMPNDVSKLSPHTIRALLARAKEHYDTVIIDTGPVPGSLEASLVSKSSDGVVMVVSRGEHRPVVERAIQHLRDIGAPIAGMVFNRADNYDVELSNTTSRLSSFDRSRTRRTADSQYVPGSQNPLFGPLAQSVTPQKDK